MDSSSADNDEEEDSFVVATTTAESGARSSQPPRVVACGYRRVRGGSSFPAWLIYLPIARRAFWRKRKDLASLASIVKAAKVPKKALDKLSEETVLPWYHDAISNDDVSVRQQLDGDEENRWNRSLDKPLQRVNQYIKEIHEHVTTNSSLRAKKVQTYKTFATWSHVPDVVPRQRLHKLSFEKTDEDDSDDDDRNVISEKEASVLADQAVSMISNRSHDDDSSNTILLVPNCGTGQVVWTLLQQDYFIRMFEKQKLTIVATNEDAEQILTCKQRDTSKLTTIWMTTSFLESTIPRSLTNELSSSCFVYCLARAESILRKETKDSIFTKCLETWKVTMFVLIASEDDNEMSSSFLVESDWMMKRIEPRDGVQLILLEQNKEGG